MKNKEVYILCGPPGSGKTTFANTKVKDFELGTVMICSADDYFVDDNGKYNYDSSKLAEAHEQCFRNFIDGVIKGYDCIIVDNTNLSVEEMIPYYSVAKSGYVHNNYGNHNDWKYDVNLVMFDVDQKVAFERQTHGVPENHHKAMFAKFKNLKFPFWMKFASKIYA